MNFLLKIKIELNSFGKVNDLNDIIYCYIDEKGINKHLINLKDKDLKLLRLPSNNDKPIYYIFKDLQFHKDMVIEGSKNTNVIFRNCTFYKSIYFKKLNLVSLKDNHYYFEDKENLYNFLKTQDVKQVIIDNEIFKGKTMGFDISGEKVMINGSYIESKIANPNFITGDNLNLSNSVIRTNGLYIDVSKLEYHNNYINSHEVNIKAYDLENSNVNNIIADKITLDDLSNNKPKLKVIK